MKSPELTISSDSVLDAIMRGSQDGLLLSDLGGHIIKGNEAIAKLIGVKAHDLKGQPLSTVLDIDAALQDGTTSNTTTDTLANELDKLPHGWREHVPAPGTIFCRNGVDLTMPATMLPVHDGSGNHCANLSIVYVVHAGSVQQAQTEFVSTVSHELRTPLTSIKGFADTILRAGDRLDATQQRRYIGIIKDQADRLTRLVEDLLAVSRLESKKMQLTVRAIDLPGTVQRVLRNLSDKAGDHRLASQMSAGLAPVWADEDRIEQVLTNLVDNAIKYSPGGTTVMVTAKEIPSDPPMVEIAVADQGVGIPAESLGEIFNKFSRLDNPLTRQTEGTGLGLYITRSLVLALGGKISVESTSSGTTFFVRLPTASLEEQAARGRG